MPPCRAPRNSNEIPTKAGDPRADQPEVLEVIAPKVHVAQPILEGGDFAASISRISPVATTITPAAAPSSTPQ